jgi:mannonate dehydratase
MKLTLGINDFSEDMLKFVGEFMDEFQRGPVQRSELVKVKNRIESYGLAIGVALLPQIEGSQHWNIRLGLAKREEEIEDVCRSIEILGAEGIPVVEYVFNLTGVWGSEWKSSARGGAITRHFNYEKAKLESPNLEFEATEEEVWGRIRYFLERVLPVAEKSGVKLACHPSPANGLNFCQGTIAEMGVDVIEAIRYFGSRKKINHVHFRNVRGSLPSFEESFIDDGEVDMLNAMQTYKEVGYTGTIMPDHTPRVEGDTPWGHRGRAFALGYIKALMKATNSRAISLEI